MTSFSTPKNVGMLLALNKVLGDNIYTGYSGNDEVLEGKYRKLYKRRQANKVARKQRKTNA